MKLNDTKSGNGTMESDFSDAVKYFAETARKLDKAEREPDEPRLVAPMSQTDDVEITTTIDHPESVADLLTDPDDSDEDDGDTKLSDLTPDEP